MLWKKKKERKQNPSCTKCLVASTDQVQIPFYKNMEHYMHAWICLTFKRKIAFFLSFSKAMSVKF